MITERADQVIWYDGMHNGILDHLGGRSFGGCLQVSLDAWKLTGAQKYMDLADKCFQSTVQHANGSTLLTPMGYLSGGNSVNWGIFASSWANLVFAEYAEIKGPSATIAGKNIRNEFLRFAKAMTAMGLTSDTTSAYTFGYQCKSTAYAYSYTHDPELLKFGKRWFDMLTAFPEGAPAVYGPSPDIHEWAPYLLNLPYCEWLVSQAKTPIAKPDWAPFYFHVPTGNPLKFIVNKTADRDWSVTMTFDSGVDFGGDHFLLSGLFTVDIIDPKGNKIQHNTFVTPNRMIPDTAGQYRTRRGGQSSADVQDTGGRFDRRILNPCERGAGHSVGRLCAQRRSDLLFDHARSSGAGLQSGESDDGHPAIRSEF